MKYWRTFKFIILFICIGQFKLPVKYLLSYTDKWLKDHDEEFIAFSHTWLFDILAKYYNDPILNSTAKDRGVASNEDYLRNKEHYLKRNRIE